MATSTNEIASAGPAPGRPVVAVWCTRKSARGAFRMDEVSNFWPAMAVPITVKMPEPMTAPIPRAVSDHGPRVFFSRCSGSSDSEISLSIDLHAKSWFARIVLPGCRNRCLRIQTDTQGTGQALYLSWHSRGLFALVHHAALHHELHPLQGGDVVQGIAVHGDDVGVVIRLDNPDSI